MSSAILSSLFDIWMIFCRETEGDSNVSGNNLRSIPDSITDSLAALAEDTLFSEVMSENLLTAIKGVRKIQFDLYILTVQNFFPIVNHLC